MIVKNNKQYYPLKTALGLKDSKVYYDRAHRGKSWFIVDLAVYSTKFIPAGSSGLVTSDDLQFINGSRRKAGNQRRT